MSSMAIPAYRRPWLLFALLTTGLWGVWGAFAGAPAENGFPETLIYVVWAFTMIPPALYALWRVDWNWPWDRRSLIYGAAVGLLGAGGQMVLFHAVRIGPTYLIFPVIALSPLVTIVLSAAILRERVTWIGGLGILCALVALPLFDFSPGGVGTGQGLAWFVLALLVLVAWGVQGFFMKYAAPVMSAEALFAYMALTGLLLAPVALAMTDFSQPINYGWSGPGLAAATQILNSIGALTLVYAFRHGRAIVVSPLANAGAPLITALISLAALGLVPALPKLAGIGLAFAAAALLTIEPEDQA
ncbi:putative membrane protein [Nitrospirillum viridazoti]|nr:putative membrane protein [Nitrospirillum amazonense]